MLPTVTDHFGANSDPVGCGDTAHVPLGLFSGHLPSPQFHRSNIVHRARSVHCNTATPSEAKRKDPLTTSQCESVLRPLCGSGLHSCAIPRKRGLSWPASAFGGDEGSHDLQITRLGEMVAQPEQGSVGAPRATATCSPAIGYPPMC